MHFGSFSKEEKNLWYVLTCCPAAGHYTLKIPHIQSQVIPSSPCVKFKLIKELVFHTQSLLNHSDQKLMSLKHLFNSGSELFFFFIFHLKIFLFGCNIGHTFSWEFIFNLSFARTYLGTKLGSWNPQICSTEKSYTLQGHVFLFRPNNDIWDLRELWEMVCKWFFQAVGIFLFEVHPQRKTMKSWFCPSEK